MHLNPINSLPASQKGVNQNGDAWAQHCHEEEKSLPGEEKVPEKYLF